MDRDSTRRLEAYLDGIGAALGHAGRAASMRAYCTGLLLPGRRKSVELLAARLAPDRVRAVHQSLHHLVAQAAWDDEALLGAVRERVLPAVERRGPVRHWVVDEVCVPKQGDHSVGVARQPCGRPGAPINCQVAVGLWVANEHASLPVAHRLYLPPAWAEDPGRRAKAGVPDAVAFETKASIALGQVRRALAGGIPAGVVLGGAGCGDEAGFRSGLDGLGLLYVLAVRPSTGLWPSCPAAPDRPVSAEEHARGLPPRARRKVTWRGGGASSRFAAVRVRPDEPRAPPGPEAWLLAEWPKSGAEPAGYWLSNLSPCTALKELVGAAKRRWRTERDRQELEQEIGLTHYEGRNWRGFHHHASLCIAAHGFLVAERCLFPPRRRFLLGRLAPSELPPGFRPRGAAR